MVDWTQGAPPQLESLDAAALWLIQQDPADDEGALRLAAALRRLAEEGPLGLPAIEAVLAAAELLERPAAEAPDRYAEAGRWLERASGDVESGAPAAPADDPALELLAADPELLEGFVAESREFLDAAEAALLVLEGSPDDREACNTVFRAFHTIKGTASFLGLDAVAELAHGAESLLSRVRDGELRLEGALADLALRSADAMRALVEAVAGAATPAAADLAALLHALDTLDAAGLEPAAAAPVRVGGPAPAQEAAPRTESGGDAWVRVRTERLDRLVDMIGELVVGHAMMAESALRLDGTAGDHTRHLAHTGKIVRELQDLSVSLRMVPLRQTFHKLTRLVRDVAHRSGKQVELESRGEETELDRTMVEQIADPLVHMIRNAVDHGIEAPAEREAAGKPRAGRLRLSAYQAGGGIVVELADDGRGLDRERILRKAVGLGLVEPDRRLTDAEVFRLIFEPGFSTAERVTDVSGRGVGMDVVRRNVEAVRGRIDIDSEPGRGTRFTVRLPLTLAVTDGMLIRVGEERYIVPTVAIERSLRPERSTLSTVAGRGELVLLRGELLPVVRLHRLFDIAGAVEDPAAGLLVVVGSGEQRCALLVDELLGQQQLVVKSLGEGIGPVRGLSGGAILGDGCVGLILDVPELVNLARSAADADAGRAAA